jgi:formate-dependent nitrite reductase membrane component NrfD
MIVVGIILILLAYFVDLGPFDTLASVLGWILLIIGLVFLVLSLVGRPVGGRKFWY